MINSLHKKIALVLVLFAQIVKPMEESSLAVLHCAKEQVCEGHFALESILAVGSVVGNLVTSDIIKSCNIYKKELSRKDQCMVIASVCSGLLAGSLFVAKSMYDNFACFTVRCGHDSQELAYARWIVPFGVMISMLQRTECIYGKTVNQLYKEGNPDGKVTWGALVKQTKWYDLVTYALGFYLLTMLHTS